MKQLIYLDNAATTKTRPEVVEAMLPYFTEYYGNPSSVYDFSTESKKAVNTWRKGDTRSHIWMWMKMEWSSWMSLRKPSGRIPSSYQ